MAKIHFAMQQICQNSIILMNILVNDLFNKLMKSGNYDLNKLRERFKSFNGNILRA